jgi:hypothetical protein
MTFGAEVPGVTTTLTSCTVVDWVGPVMMFNGVLKIECVLSKLGLTSHEIKFMTNFFIIQEKITRRSAVLSLHIQ